MATVEFLANDLGPAVTAEAPEGSALIDVCDEAGAPVSFSCRSASCGVCRVEVLAGAPLLDVPSEEELAVLAIFEAPAAERLACQAQVKPGEGLVRLRWAGGDD
jgi:ferredoxin